MAMDPFTLVLLAILGFAVLLIAGIGRRKTPERVRQPLLPRLVAATALLIAFLSAVSAVVTVVLTLVGDTVTLTVPVISSIELVPADLRDSDSSVVGGATQQSLMTLTVAGLDMTTRIFIAFQIVTQAAVYVTVLVMVARLAQQSIAAEPFTPTLRRLLIVGGVALAVGATITQIAGTVAGALAQEQLFFIRTDALEGSVNVAPAWSFDLVPIGVGLALIVVAGLIRSGERLQHDTAGLV